MYTILYVRNSCPYISNYNKPKYNNISQNTLNLFLSVGQRKSILQCTTYLKNISHWLTMELSELWQYYMVENPWIYRLYYMVQNPSNSLCYSAWPTINREKELNFAYVWMCQKRILGQFSAPHPHEIKWLLPGILTDERCWRSQSGLLYKDSQIYHYSHYHNHIWNQLPYYKA